MEHVRRFNSDLKALTRDVASRRPTDAVLWRAERRIATAIDIDPLMAIKAVGPVLYQYADMLTARSESFFQPEFDTEIQRHVAAAAPESEATGMALQIIPRARAIMLELDGEKRTEYFDLLNDILDSYLEWMVG